MGAYFVGSGLRVSAMEIGLMLGWSWRQGPQELVGNLRVQMLTWILGLWGPVWYWGRLAPWVSRSWTWGWDHRGWPGAKVSWKLKSKGADLKSISVGSEPKCAGSKSSRETAGSLVPREHHRASWSSKHWAEPWTWVHRTHWEPSTKGLVSTCVSRKPQFTGAYQVLRATGAIWGHGIWQALRWACC